MHVNAWSNKYNTKHRHESSWKQNKQSLLTLSESFQRRSPENEISLKLWVNQITRLGRGVFR